MNNKLRLVVTAKCHNHCPMCCNNRFDLNELPVMDRWDYGEIMLTGGEPNIKKLIEKYEQQHNYFRQSYN